jgi:hypothetical protein
VLGKSKISTKRGSNIRWTVVTHNIAELLQDSGFTKRTRVMLEEPRVDAIFMKLMPGGVERQEKRFVIVALEINR